LGNSSTRNNCESLPQLWRGSEDAEGTPVPILPPRLARAGIIIVNAVENLDCGGRDLISWIEKFEAVG
jgi:hypothetical protein